MPPTTSATPGITRMPSSRLCRSKRAPVIAGSMSAVTAGASAMQVAATEAFASFTDP